MALLPELMPFMGEMLGSISESAMASANLFNSSLNYNVGQQSFQNAQAINQAQMQNRSDLAVSGQNFTATENNLNRDFSQNMFTQGLQGAQSLQEQRFASLNTLQDARITAAQGMQSNAIGSSFARGALNFGSGLLNTGLQFLQNSQVASLQRENFDYMTNKAEDAYTSSGLPSWLAFQGSGPTSLSSQLPRTAQVVNGQNTMTSSLPGNPMSTPWSGSDSQSAFGFGDVPTAQ